MIFDRFVAGQLDLLVIQPELIMNNGHQEENNPYTDYGFQGKSPFSKDGKSILLADNSGVEYKGIKFQAIQFHYECQETKNCFTTDEIDEINIRIILAKYRNVMLFND